MAAKSFRDLRVWQIAEDLCVEVYSITDMFPKHEVFGLTSQLRRSIISVPSNIAEGFGRRFAKEKDQFYHHALGSLYEADTQLGIARRLGDLEESVYGSALARIDECRSTLLKLIQVNRQKFSNH